MCFSLPHNIPSQPQHQVCDLVADSVNGVAVVVFRHTCVGTWTCQSGSVMMC